MSRFQEPPVVGDHDHRALEADEGLLEDLGRRDVEVIGRLVEKEQVPRLEQELRQGETARSPPEKPETPRRGSSPKKRKRARYCARPRREVAADASDLLDRRQRRVQRRTEVLIEVALLQRLVPRLNRPTSSASPRPARSFRSVVLPEPFGPTTPIRSPRRTRRSKS